MGKTARFVEGFVLGATLTAAAAWYYFSDRGCKECQHDDANSPNRTQELIQQTRDAIDKGFDRLSKMADARHTQSGGQSA